MARRDPGSGRSLSTAHAHGPTEGHPHLAATGRGLAAVFWALAAGVIVAYVFFLALGAFGSGEVGAVTVAVIVLAALWLLHGLLGMRQRRDGQDAAIVRERERRGF
jgi:fatty acid desaturase